MNRRIVRLAAAALLSLAAGTTMAQPVSSAFTYQGKLMQSGQGATALFDFQFKLYDSLTGGTQLGPTVALPGTSVNAGLFTANLDFGNQYTGSKRWLQIEVRSAGGGSYTVLTPRQELTATPHAQALALPMTETISTPAALINVNNTGPGDGIYSITSGGGLNTGGVYATAGGLNSNGVVGIANNGSAAYGVWGISATGPGVVGNGLATGGSFGGNVGVYGASSLAGASGVGVQGAGGQGYIGVRGDSTTGGSSSFGVFGMSTDVGGNGVRGQCDNGSSAFGLWRTSASGEGVVGAGLSFGGDFTGNTGVQGTGNDVAGAGVHGTGGTTALVGVLGDATAGGGSSFGGKFTSNATSGNGVSGTCNLGTSAWGVVGTSSTGQAGHFNGNVQVVGSLSKSSGTFEIDHPLDPANKYLYHSFVESPDMMNIYNGNASLDGTGSAVIVMPDWFESLNTEFRYQLTCIGAFAPVYVASEIKGNRFVIAGGQPGQRVSWQVTGIRQDAWANAHRVQVEVEKPAEERGRYLHPELFGMPASMSVFADKLAALEAQTQAPAAAENAAKLALPTPPAPAAPATKEGR